MLKFIRTISLLLLISVLAAGCSVLNGDAIRIRLLHIEDELFSQSTVTMPVLVTSTYTPTATMTPTITLTPTVTMTPTATLPVMEYASPTFEVLYTAEIPISAKDVIKNITDVTVPDDTMLEPGELFIKSWRMTNNGESIWSSGTRLMMEANYDMDMPQVVKAVFIRPNDWIDFTPGGWGNRVHNVGHGTEVDLAVILRAPAEPGAYQIHFRLVNPNGEIIPTQFWMRFGVSRPTETPTPTPATGTPEPEILPYDWEGRWMVREPFHTEGIIPVNAWLDQNGDEITGFLYTEEGDPIIIKGALSGEGKIFNGEIFYPWQKQTTPVTWSMEKDRHQFYAITETGSFDDSAICGARDGENFPGNCTLPSGG